MAAPKFCFVNTPQGRVLQSTFSDLGKGFFLDYEKGSLGYRLTPKRVLHEPLAKVIDRQSFVLDAMGGLLKDAIMMAFLGCKVWTHEAHPLVSELVNDGLFRAKKNLCLAEFIEDEQRFRFFATDSRLTLEHLLQNPELERPDLVYLDPMFPPKRKSSIAKREIQWLQRIHAATTAMYPNFSISAPELIFELALQVAQKRIIVKRPLIAPPLVAAPSPSFSRNFQSSRFDVYIMAKSD